MTLEKKIESLILDMLEDIGYNIVRVKYSSSSGTLQIMIEKQDDSAVTVDDCARVSNVVSTILDVEDPIKDAYSLEISSPGIDRPLTKFEDFKKYVGSQAKLKLKAPLDNTRKLKGELIGTEENSILLQLDTGAELKIDYINIDSANLLISDSLFNR